MAILSHVIEGIQSEPSSNDEDNALVSQSGLLSTDADQSHSGSSGVRHIPSDQLDDLFDFELLGHPILLQSTQFNCSMLFPDWLGRSRETLVRTSFHSSRVFTLIAVKQKQVCKLSKI